MITVSPTDNGVLGAHQAFNAAGNRIEGRVHLDQHGSGEMKFVPDVLEDYEAFLKEDRDHEAAQEG